MGESAAGEKKVFYIGKSENFLWLGIALIMISKWVRGGGARRRRKKRFFKFRFSNFKKLFLEGGPKLFIFIHKTAYRLI